MFSLVTSKHQLGAESNISENMSDDKIRDWIASFQHDENNTRVEIVNQKKPKFRHSYLTYLKLLRELSTKTALSEKVVGMVGEGEIIFPSSHSLTQTDREYFNIVRTEDGQSMFAREQDREIHNNKREGEGEGNKKEKKRKRK